MLGNLDPQTEGVLLLNQMPWAKITRLKIIENDTALEDQTLHFRTESL